MKVFEIITRESCAVLQPADPDRSTEVIGTGGFTGWPMRPRWECLAFHFEDPTVQATDFVHLIAGGLAFNRRAWLEFSPLFQRVGEILELTVNDEPYYALNVLRRVGALDLISSGAELYTHGTIKSLERYAFIAPAVLSESIFRVPQLRTSLFATEATTETSQSFVRRYAEGRYTGLRFKSVWEEAQV